jgi:hypothetical protein
MHVHEPEVAKKWDKKYGGGGSNLPYHKKQKKSKYTHALK